MLSLFVFFLPLFNETDYSVTTISYLHECVLPLVCPFPIISCCFFTLLAIQETNTVIVKPVIVSTFPLLPDNISLFVIFSCYT